MALVTKTTKRRHRPRRSDAWSSLTCAEVARIYQITAQGVGLWVHKGCPRNPDGTYDLSAVVRWREARIAGEKSESDWETEGQKWRALRHKHELETRQGQYLLAADVAAWWSDRITEARTALQSLGTAVAPACVGVDAAGIRRLIDDRCRAICESLARQARDATEEPEETTSA